MHVENLILDFDDTLVVGPVTWAIETGLPRFIDEHRLEALPDVLNAALLRAQETASGGDDPIAVLTRFFVEMGWDSRLQMQLFDEVSERYQPSLFPDTVPFLESITSQVGRVIVLSNNNRAPSIAERLGIAGMLPLIMTPKRSPGALPKPDRGLWTALTRQFPQISAANSLMIGDDPWSDGAFALTCGLECWLVDRQQRYRHLNGGAYRFIDALPRTLPIKSG